MINEILKRYESFSDGLISKISYERNHMNNIGKAEIYMTVMNAQDDYVFEKIKLSFIGIQKFRFVENENTSSFVINSAFIKEE